MLVELLVSFPFILFYSLVLGLLAVGSQRGLSVYTLILENDLLMWSEKWMHPYVYLHGLCVGALTRLLE
jgi:hypothetical protein